MGKNDLNYIHFDILAAMSTLNAEDWPQIASQNGQNATHRFSMITTQFGQPKTEHLQQIVETPNIKHLKQEETKACQYDGPNKPNMKEKKKKSCPSTSLFCQAGGSTKRALLDDLDFFLAVGRPMPRTAMVKLTTKIGQRRTIFTNDQ